MQTKFTKLLDTLHSSFWFVPTLMVAAAILLSFVTIQIDQNSRTDLISNTGWAYALGPSGSRAILSAIAGSMISVATTAFSITIVALQLASSQFGPRLLRNFMQDTGNQVVLGTFISTFVYSLMVLRTINGVNENEFVPHLAVTVGLGLALASVGVLIYFIHHSAASIQVDNVIGKVAEELEAAIDKLFPTQIGRGASKHRQEPLSADIPANFDLESSPIPAASSCYVQAIDTDVLMQIAKDEDLLIAIQHRPGDFVVKGSPLVLAYPAAARKKLVKQINDAFILGVQRTVQQDVKFPIEQLVEIAARALSPGINDPFTAVTCIDRLSAALCHLAQKEIPSSYRYDDQDKLRVITRSVTFEAALDKAFNQIRQYGHSSVAVTIRLLDAIGTIAPFTHTKADLTALLRHANTIERGSQDGIVEALDRQDVRVSYLGAVKAINNHRSKYVSDYKTDH